MGNWWAVTFEEYVRGSCSNKQSIGFLACRVKSIHAFNRYTRDNPSRSDNPFALAGRNSCHVWIEKTECLDRAGNLSHLPPRSGTILSWDKPEKAGRRANWLVRYCNFQHDQREKVSVLTKAGDFPRRGNINFFLIRRTLVTHHS